MKRCPECGERMRLGMGQWVHVEPAACRIVTLRATAEEIAAHAQAINRPRPSRPARRDEARRFGYLTSEG